MVANDIHPTSLHDQINNFMFLLIYIQYYLKFHSNCQQPFKEVKTLNKILWHHNKSHSGLVQKLQNSNISAELVI